MMKRDIKFDDFGFYCGDVTCPDDVTNPNSVPRVDDRRLDYTYFYKDNDWYTIGERPTEFHIMDKAKRLWIDPRPIDHFRTVKWEAIKVERDALEFGGFMYKSGRYDSDQVSQGRIMGAVMAQVDQVWTLANNTTVDLTASQLMQLYQALQMHVAVAHERGRIAREAIQAATTKEQIEAIVF